MPRLSLGGSSMNRKTWTAVALVAIAASVAIAVAHQFQRSQTELQKKLGAPRRTGSGGVLGRIVLVCGAITAGAGTLILVGWAIGWHALTAMGTGYPTAPNTALLLALLGSAVLVREVRPASRVIHRVATAAAVCSAVVASVTLIGLVIGLNIDDWLFRTTRTLGEVPMGRMSPVTAFCFVLAGVSLLLLERQARRWGAILGTVITLVGAVCLMGYGFGAPLLYGGSVIPVALPTSLALVALGVGLTAAAGSDTWPLEILIGPSTRARLLRALLPTVVPLALINDWIIAVLLEHSDPGVVLASALTAVSFLLVVGFVVSRVSRAIGNTIDRTQAELAQAAEALRESEGKHRRIYDSLQDLYVETALDGTILEISPQVETLSDGHYKREDLLGRSANAFYCDPERRTAFLRTLTLLGSVKDFEATFLNRDGSEVPCSISAMLRPDADGKPARIVSMMRDITGRKRAEESLRESEERLRAIFEGALDGILVADAGSGKVLTGNPAICRMLGYTLHEIVRLGVSDIHPKQDLSPVIEEFKRLQRGESQVVADFPVIRKDGSVFRADMQLALIRLGVTDYALAIIHDISERKRAEQELRRIAAELRKAYRRLAQAQEAERRALTKELHDQVGQNLSALNLNLHYIDRELSDAERAKLKGRLDDCLVLLDETVARVRSVMGTLRPPMLDEFGLFATLRWWAHETTQRSGIPCTLAGPDLAQRLPAEMESALLRIAQEALMNAVKYSKAREIRIALTATPQQAQMEIVDDGVGFDPLARDANVSKPTWGLTTMRERADALGGNVQVNTAPGKGTRVVAEIPRA